MHFSRLLRNVSLAVLLSCTSVIGATAQTSMTHRVTEGETLFKIAKNYGVSVQQLLECNKGLTPDVIRTGQTLIIPAPQLPKAQPVPARQPEPQVKMKDYKVKKKDTPYSLAKANNITVDELMAANPQLEADDWKLKKGTTIKIPVKVKQSAPKYVGISSIKVAIVLPLVGSRTEHVRSVEFYRGFLMGIEKLKEQGISVGIHAYEEPAPDTPVKTLMTSVMASQPDLIIGPVYPTHFEDVAACASAQTNVVVPFSSKVPQVESCPNLFVVNTPASYETTLSTELLQSVFKKSDHFVFLHAANANKGSFCQALISHLTTAGYDVTGVAAHSTAVSISQTLKAKGTGRFVLIPDDSGETLMAELLGKMRELRSLMNGSTFSIVGYDNWVKHSEGQYRQALHEADAHLLASSYFYPYTADATQFRTSYKDWFKTDLLTYTPRMAPLGYDVAISMLGGMATYGHAFNTQNPAPGTIAALPKLQSDLRFIKASTNGGYVSRSMWIVEFRPDGTIVKLSAK